MRDEAAFLLSVDDSSRDFHLQHVVKGPIWQGSNPDPKSHTPGFPFDCRCKNRCNPLNQDCVLTVTPAAHDAKFDDDAILRDRNSEIEGQAIRWEHAAQESMSVMGIFRQLGECALNQGWSRTPGRGREFFFPISGCRGFVSIVTLRYVVLLQASRRHGDRVADGIAGYK